MAWHLSAGPLVLQDQLCVHALCLASLMLAPSTFLDNSTTVAAGIGTAPTTTNVRMTRALPTAFIRLGPECNPQHRLQEAFNSLFLDNTCDTRERGGDYVREEGNRQVRGIRTAWETKENRLCMKRHDEAHYFTR